MHHINTNHPQSDTPRKSTDTYDNEKCDKCLQKLIFGNGLPLSIMESNDFKAFVESLNINYKIASRRHFTYQTLPAVYEKARMKQRTSLATCTYVSFTTDTWTSTSIDSYMAITVHFVDETTTFRSFLLDIIPFSMSHTAENLKEMFSNVMSHY